jgi:hypothetical protein
MGSIEVPTQGPLNIGQVEALQRAGGRFGTPDLVDTGRSATMSPRLAQRAADRLERDVEWSQSMGLARPDVQRLRQEIEKGPGWIDRVEGLLGKGLFPAFAAGIGLSEALNDRP